MKTLSIVSVVLVAAGFAMAHQSSDRNPQPGNSGSTMMRNRPGTENPPPSIPRNPRNQQVPEEQQRNRSGIASYGMDGSSPRQDSPIEEEVAYDELFGFLMDYIAQVDTDCDGNLWEFLDGADEDRQYANAQGYPTPAAWPGPAF